MLGKLLVGSGCLLCALWPRPAAAESTGAKPVAGEAQLDAAESTAPPSDIADEGVSNTVLLGFQAPGHAARLQSDAHPDGIAKGWFTLCFAPCTRRVPAMARFRAVGEHADPSESFRLPDGQDRVLVTTTLKKPSHTVPIVLTAVGFSALLIGPIVFIGGLAKGLNGQDPHGVMVLTGATLTVGGAIAGTAGLIWLVSGSKDRKSVVTIARSGPRLALPGGLGLESRGFTF